MKKTPNILPRLNFREDNFIKLVRKYPNHTIEYYDNWVHLLDGTSVNDSYVVIDGKFSIYLAYEYIALVDFIDSCLRRMDNEMTDKYEEVLSDWYNCMNGGMSSEKLLDKHENVIGKALRLASAADEMGKTLLLCKKDYEGIKRACKKYGFEKTFKDCGESIEYINNVIAKWEEIK